MPGWKITGIILAVLLQLFNIAQLSGQELPLSFQHLGTEDGLSNPDNSFVYRDSRGFAWISSTDGLNRFDGREVVVYKPDPEDSTSIGGNIVNSNFFEDEDGNLWFSTYSGISCYLRKYNQFKNFQLKDAGGENITADYHAFHLDGSGRLWVRTGLGNAGRLHLFNTETDTDRIAGQLDGQRCKIELGMDGDISGVWGYLITKKPKGLQWFPWTGTDQDGRLGNPANPLKGRDLVVLALHKHSDRNEYWLGTEKGIAFFSQADSSFTFYNEINGIELQAIWSVVPANDSILFASSQNGLLEFNMRSRIFTNLYQARPFSNTSLRDNEIYDLYIDPHHILWVSIWGKGLDYTSLRKVRFPLLKPGGDAVGKLRIRSIAEDKKGRIWVATLANGIYIYNPQGDLDDKLLPASISEQYEAISWLFPDNSGQFWMVAHPMTRERYHLLKYTDQNGIEHRGELPGKPYSMEQLQNGIILIATSLGIYQFDPAGTAAPARNPAFSDLDSSNIMNIFQDRAGVIYVNVNFDRLDIYKRRPGGLEMIRQLPGLGYCSSFYEPENDSIIWISSSTGLIRFDKKNLGYRLLTPDWGGIANESYFNLLPGHRGDLWLKTREGLLNYLPADSTSYRYGPEDGALEIESDFHFALKTSREKLWFSSTGGINVFDPRQINPIMTKPQLHITHILVNDEEFESDRSFPEIDSLQLPFTDNTVSFQFTANEFTDPGSNKFAYRLKGFDDKWVQSGDVAFARYANIPPGQYEFQLKATNSDGIWAEESIGLHLSILPPWWQTWWARLLFILLATGVTYIIWHNERKKTRRKLALQAERLEQQERVNQELRHVDRLKDQFLANTSHELRTPLHGIIGLTGNLIDGSTGELPDKTKKQLRMIRSSGKRLANLVNDILDFSKLKHKDLQLKLKAVDLRTVTDIVLRISQPLASSHQLELKNEIAEDFPLVKADEDRLQQILFNLVGNAIKFTEQGTIAVSAQKREDEMVTILVRDTGIGIPDERQKDIFNWFEQAHGDEDHNFGGTGIGLAVTKRLVELHGGTIEVKSKEGTGTTFSFSLPLSKEGVHTTAKDALDKYDEEYAYLSGAVLQDDEKSGDYATGTAYNPAQTRILVVDDEPVNLQVIGDFLGMADYRVESVLSAKEALARLEAGNKYSLLIADIMMPHMSGFELSQKVREQYSRAELPIILLTSKNRVSDLAKGFEIGANDYLVKPFSKGELLSRVKAHINLLHFHDAARKFVPREFLSLIGKEDLLEVKRGDHAECTVTVLFGDIRGYTGLSEEMGPEKNFNFINEYAGRMGPIIRKNQGFINQYLGDGIMAIFPETPDYALQCAIAMQQEIIAFSDELAERDRKPFEIGVGFHTGQLVLGIIGDEERSDPATVADTVNVAARLEGLTKHFGARIIISSESYRRLDNPGNFHIRYLGEVTVKGKLDSTEVYECVDGDPEEVQAGKIESMQSFREALELYLQKEFYESYGLFKKLVEANPGDKVARHFMDRAVTYLHDGVPEGWTGKEHVGGN